jgi:hypothetical protein
MFYDFPMPIFRDERIWRWLTNLWTVALALFLIWNFFAKGSYDFLMAPFSVIYAGVLGLYAGTKEFDRWYDLHESRHPGEWFVIGWTVIVLILTTLSFVLGKAYSISPEAVADYIMVLSIFALTQKSKQLHRRKGEGQ